MGLLDDIFGLIDSAKELANTVSVQKTSEFKTNVKELELELENKSDYELLVEFHSAYADNQGIGLVSSRSNFGADPEYFAYRNVLEKRHIRAHVAFCTHCENKDDLEIRMGYRFFFVSSRFIQSNEEVLYENNHNNLVRGYCSCWRCGKRYTWVLEDGYDGTYDLELTNLF